MPAPEEVLPATGDEASWTPTQRALIIAMGLVWKDRNSGDQYMAPRHVVEAFLYQCRRTGLDPLARQVYSIARWDSQLGGPKWTTQTSIDGFRVIAERHGKYAGQGDVEWLTEDGRWVDVFVAGKPGYGDHPLAARATVMRHDFTQPLRAVANWDGYAQNTSFWKGGQGPNQIAKCAEALALRKAFPQDLSGLYTAEEMAQADAVTAPQEQSALPAGQSAAGAPASAQPAAAANTGRPVDPEEQNRWWDRLRVITYLGVKGSGDGGLRNAFQEAKEAGVLSWPIGPGEEQTFREWLIQQSARLPEAAEAEAVDADGDPVDDDASAEDVPMVYAATPAAQPAQVSEPLPPAPAGAADPQRPGSADASAEQSGTRSDVATTGTTDEADPDVPPWAHAEQPVDAWVDPSDPAAERPF